MNMALKGFAIAATLFLLGCAAPRIHDEPFNYEEWSQMRFVGEAHVVNPENLPREGRQEAIRKLLNVEGQACFDRYVSSFTSYAQNVDRNAIRNSSTARKDFVRSLENMERELDQCLGEAGMEGGPYFVSVLEKTARPSEIFLVMAQNYQNQQNAKLVAAVMGAFSAGAVNGSLVPVSGYVRADGTYVRPHMRTAPDGYCWNNLSGC